MSEDVETSFSLPRRPYRQSAGFAVGCAERLLPMAASLGGRAIAETTEPGLALAWKAAAGLGGRSEIEQAITALTDAIHHAADDGFEVLGAHAANVTVFALEAVSGSTRAGWVSLARAGTLGLVREVDFELALPPEAARTLTFSDQDEIPQGPLERAEVGAQRTSLDLLDVGYAPDAQALEAVRRLSRLRAGELARVLPEFTGRGGRRYEELERRRAAQLAEIARRQDRKPP
jgi:hypothetical protein